MSGPRLCFEEVNNEDIQNWNSLSREEVNITTYANSISTNEPNRKSCNQEHFALTFPKPPMPGRKERSRLSELQITVPTQVSRKREEDQKPAHTWIRHSLKRFFQWPSIYLTFKLQAPPRHPHFSQTHPIEAENKKSKNDIKAAPKKDSKKKNYSHAINPEFKSIVKNDKTKRRIKGDKSPSISPNEGKLIKSKSGSEKSPVLKNFKAMSKNILKYKTNSKTYKKSDTESKFNKRNINKDSKTSNKNSDCKSGTFSINSSNINLMMYSKESVSESTDIDVWLKNYSHNNAKKPPKKDAKRSSDADSADSKDAKKGAKKDKKPAKKDDKKKDAKDLESTDAESGDSRDAKKGAKKDKKPSKKDDKKKDAKKGAVSTDTESGDSRDAKKVAKKDKKPAKKDDKKKEAKRDTESTDAESGDSTDAKKGAKKDQKASKKDFKKKDAKNEAESTDVESGDSKDSKQGKKLTRKASKKNDGKKDTPTDSESELESNKGKKNDKKVKKDSKNVPIKKDIASTELDTESEADFKKGKKDEAKTKKSDIKKDAKKAIESTESESELESKKAKKDSKKEKRGSKKDVKREVKKYTESTDAESDKSLSKPAAKKRSDDSDATSADSRKGVNGLKKGFRMSSKKTTFSEKQKDSFTCRIPPSREKAPLPPCETFLPLPRVKRRCQCKMPPPPPKPRYAPLPEAKWIHKLL
ncbi:cylicin-1 [Cavia porcellus]|uniref:cylicin-1 n=1 Tax=Cavia porcellus TaxID=10141 RepID=UPI002FE253C1